MVLLFQTHVTCQIYYLIGPHALRSFCRKIVAGIFLGPFLQNPPFSKSVFLIRASVWETDKNENCNRAAAYFWTGPVWICFDKCRVSWHRDSIKHQYQYKHF